MRRSSHRPRVGIDLAPASRGSLAPGTARHVTEQARALFRLEVGWDWVVLVESEGNPLYAELAHLDPRVVSGRRFWTRATFEVGKAWQRAGCQLGFATAYFVPWRGVPVVANFFDSNLYEHGDTWVSSGRRWNYYLNRLLFAHSLRRSERLFFLSEYCREVMVNRFPSIAGKALVTPCGITPPPEEARAAPAWAQEMERPFLLYVGVFSDNKNQRTLLAAWRELQQSYPDLPNLVLVGACDRPYWQQVIAPLLRQLPRQSDVIHLTNISDAELEWAYRHALAYIQPSIAEGFGLPVAEAMARRLAVVCSDTTSLPEVAGDAALYFEPRNVPSMKQAIVEVWKNAELRESLAGRGVERSKLYRWEKNARIVAQEIERVLGEIATNRNE